jgi:transcriptional regulator CtsR
MAFSPFNKIRLGPDQEPTSKHVNTVQDNIAQALGQLLGKDALDTTVINNQPLNPSGINYVNHTLGRVLQGWHVVRTHGTGTAIQVWDVQAANKSPQLQLYLMASATGIFDIQVF